MTDEYRRRLKRYEAAETACAHEALEDGGSMDFFSPFGPMIARLSAPAWLVDKINHYAEQRILAHEGPGGARSPEGRLDHFSLEEGFVLDGGAQSLASQTARWIGRYLALADDRELDKLRFENFWAVRHFAQTFSPVHFHSGDVSGVLYLKLPDSIANEREEERRSYLSARRAGYITFLIGGKQRFSKSLISFKPRVGDFYLFPGWLLHAVEPFDGEGERRSMSFNAFID
jgi:hypothetical protein